MPFGVAPSLGMTVMSLELIFQDLYLWSFLALYFQPFKFRPVLRLLHDRPRTDYYCILTLKECTSSYLMPLSGIDCVVSFHCQASKLVTQVLKDFFRTIFRFFFILVQNKTHSRRHTLRLGCLLVTCNMF